MGTKQHAKYRVTFSISERAHEKLQEISGSKSAWVEQLIMGTPISDDRLEIERLNRVELRLNLLEVAVVAGKGPIETDTSSATAGSEYDPTQDDGISHLRGDTIIPGGVGRLGSRRVRDPGFRQRVVQLRRAGRNYKQITRELRTSSTTVNRILREHNLA